MPSFNDSKRRDPRTPELPAAKKPAPQKPAGSDEATVADLDLQDLMRRQLGDEDEKTRDD